MASIRVLEYLERSGRSPWRRWFNELDAHAAAKIGTALYRLGQGNFSTVEGVGGGVFEIKIDFGPGYRIYFAKDGETVIILLVEAQRSGKALRLGRHTKRGRTTSSARKVLHRSRHGTDAGIQGNRRSTRTA